MNKLTSCIMWISCAVVSIAGMFILKNSDTAVCMAIPFAVIIVKSIWGWKIYFKERNNTWLNIFVTYVAKNQSI